MNLPQSQIMIKAARKAPGIAQTLSYESAAMLTATDIMNDGDPCGSPFFYDMAPCNVFSP